MRTVEWGSFVECASIEFMELPDSLSVITEPAFMGCENMCVTYMGQKYYYNDTNKFFDFYSLVNNGGTVPTTPATPATPAADFTFYDENGVLTVTGYNGTDSEITIPAEIDGKPVKTVAGGEVVLFALNATLKKVVISEGVEKITSTPFSYFSNDSLEELTLPDSLIALEGGAFNGAVNMVINFKGQTYRYEELDSLYAAINGGTM